MILFSDYIHQLLESLNEIKEKDTDLSVLNRKYKRELQLNEMYDKQIKQYEREKLYNTVSKSCRCNDNSRINHQVYYPL